MSTITESTKIKLSLIVGGMVFLLGAGSTFAGIIWWASAIQSKLDTVNITLKSLETLTAEATAATRELDKQAEVRAERSSGRFDAIERRVTLIENKFSREPRNTTPVREP